MPLFLRCEPGTRLTVIAHNVDGTGFPLGTGDALRLRFYELQDGGTLKQFDFTGYTFKTGVCTTDYVTMTHRTTQAGGHDTLLFTYELTSGLGTANGFATGKTYIAEVQNHDNADAPESLTFRYMTDGSVLGVESSGLPAIAGAVLAASTAGAAEGTLGGDVRIGKAMVANKQVIARDAATATVYKDDGATVERTMTRTTTETGSVETPS